MNKLMVWEQAGKLKPLALTGLGWLLFVIGHSAVIAVRARTMPWTDWFTYTVDAVVLLIPILMILRGTLRCLDGCGWVVAVLLIEVLVGAFLWTILNFFVHLGVGGNL